MLRAQDDITARGCVIKMFGDSWLSEQLNSQLLVLISCMNLDQLFSPFES